MRFRPTLAFLTLSLLPMAAQETRSTLNGRVYDQLSAAIAGAKVTLTNVETNTAVKLTTNQTGYYEAPLLMPGNYQVSAEADGFKTAVRQGVVLSVGAQLAVDLHLELGAVTQTIDVSAEPLVLDTSSIEAGALIDNQSLMDLPVMGNNPILLAKLAPGMQTDGVNNYLGLHSIVGGSSYNVAAGVGGNEWSIDGVPNNGGSRRAAYLPYSDTIAEFRIDTTGFDVSQGRGTGASVMAMTKSGTNQWHGTMTEQHWQQRLNATPYFTRQLYFKRIADAKAKGDLALANQLASQPRQPSGHSNNYAATIGGPVIIPKIYNGRNRLFSFFSFNGFMDVKTEDPSNFNKTVPTMANRQGDFSQLLQVDASRYQIYDPLTVRRDPDRSGHWIRDPMEGNIIPKSRFINPMYNAYMKLYPVPNADPTSPREEPRNNYLAFATPYNWNYRAFQHRVDYNFSGSHRFFARWSWNNFLEDRGDWTYSTLRGLNSNGLNRKNMAATIDWTWTINSRTLLDIAAAANEYTDGSRQPVPMSFKPSDVGLPEYLDAWAGDQHILPQVSVGGYSTSSPGGVPTYTHFRVYSVAGNVSQIRGPHSIKAGIDTRHHFRTGGGGGNTSGNFGFNNSFTRRNDDSFVAPGDLGLSWAAFIMGLPNSASITAGNATYATYSPYYGGFVQDTWRIHRRLTLNVGLRLEYEGGPTERYNRVIGYFDRNARIFVSDKAEAFYAANPIPLRDPSTFVVRGGATFPGVSGVPRNAWQGQWMAMPRFAFAWQLGSKMVIRGGAGTFFDTLNVTNNTPNQTGFNRTTSATIETNFGQNWSTGDPANGISPLVDPFPVRANGTRFDTSTNGELGVNTLAGRGYTFADYPTRRAHQYRWRLGMQRQVAKSMVIGATYVGSYSEDVYVTLDLNPVPAQYWWNGNVRNSALASNLNGGVANPFRLANFPTLASDNPTLYADMFGQSFFRNSTVSRAQLLKPFPQMTGLSQSSASLGRVRTHGVELTFSRRFSRGFTLNVNFTGTKARTADWFPNSYDRVPAWRESNYSRPYRLTSTGTYQLPFGRRRAFFQHGVMSKLLGGFQLSGTFEWQAGPLLDWGNLYYYGDRASIKLDNPTLNQWINNTGSRCGETAGTNTGFQRCANQAPDSYQARVFPQRLPGVRRDRTLQTNANVQREFPVYKERARLYLRFDMLNVFNRSQFDSPSTDPLNTNFGRVTAQSSAINRFQQFQARLQF
jgi:hypothetical protein